MSIAETIRPSPPSIPKLRHGEHLSRDEFERRYEHMTDRKAELLDGVVYLAPPRVTVDHGRANSSLAGWLCHYSAFTPGVEGGLHATTRLSELNEVQPDNLFRILETHGGRSSIDADDFVAGSPELLGEVTKNSKSYDCCVKPAIYKRHGVRELILWRNEDEVIDWFILRNNDYEPLKPDAAGIVRSETFPGLWLDVNAMIRRDGQQVLKVLQQGIASPEHAEFVERLRMKAEKKG